MSYKELEEMAKKKLLTRRQLELLSQFDEKRLELIFSTLVTDLFLLTEEDLKTLLRYKGMKRFKEKLNEIKNKLTDADFSVLERGILYQVAKFFGHLEFRKKDTTALQKELSFLINRVITPAVEMILFYRKNGTISERDFAPLKEAIEKLIQKGSSRSIN